MQVGAVPPAPFAIALGLGNLILHATNLHRVGETGSGRRGCIVDASHLDDLPEVSLEVLPYGSATEIDRFARPAFSQASLTEFLGAVMGRRQLSHCS